MEYIATFDSEKKEYLINGKNIKDIDYIFYLLDCLEEDYLLTHRKESIEVLTELQFQGFLMFVFNQLFCVHKYMGYNFHLQNNEKSILLDNDTILYQLSEWFIYYATNHNKTCNTYNYALLIGCDYRLVLNWINYKPNLYSNNNSVIYSNDNNDTRNDIDGHRLTPVRWSIAKNLLASYEQSLQGMLVSNKGNPVGVIAVLNHRFNWGGIETRTESRANLITADSLPRLDKPKNDQ